MYFSFHKNLGKKRFRLDLRQQKLVVQRMHLFNIIQIQHSRFPVRARQVPTEQDGSTTSSYMWSGYFLSPSSLQVYSQGQTFLFCAIQLLRQLSLHILVNLFMKHNFGSTIYFPGFFFFLSIPRQYLDHLY